ncbi:MAG: alpha-2-macroglobulin family protein [bacterium]|nr:alpha-2-macroglobulin family protein [bacterium]
MTTKRTVLAIGCFAFAAFVLGLARFAAVAPAPTEPGIQVKLIRVGEDDVSLKFSALPRGTERLWAKITDLDGKELAGASRVFDKGELQVRIPAKIDATQLAKYAVEYWIVGREPRYRKSLFYLADKLQTIVLAQKEYYAGSLSGLRVIVRNHTVDEAIEGAKVRVSLKKDDKETELFAGATNADGTVDASFRMPAAGEGAAELAVKVETDIGKEEIKEHIRLKTGNKILLTTDKPMYQPGHLIHMRSLALTVPDSKAVADSPAIFEVMDSKGNKVFKKETKTDEFGVSFADFQLADELNQGRYTVRVSVGKGQQEKTVTVERYVLPKFKIALKTEKDFYEPGETVKGDVQVDYFFGKPVAEGKLTIKFSKFDVGFEEFATITATLDSEGHHKFEQKLPDHFVGQPLEQGKAFVKVDVSVVDTADHKEELTRNVSVTKSAITVVAVPESGDLIPNIENKVYFVTTYADGRPAKTEMTVVAQSAGESGETSVKTDEGGFGEMTLTPQTQSVALKIEGKDEKGNRFSQALELQPKSQGTDSVLVRTDKALFKVGDSVGVSVFSTKKKGTAYIDVIRDNQTILTKTLSLSDGSAATRVDLDENLVGAVGLSAYIISSDGNIVRDRRLLFVDPANDLNLGISSDKDTYLPAEYAKVNFKVTDKEGHPVLAALGIMVVDEAIFALQEMQPGMEKVYFYLEEQIMKPRYEIHAYDMKDVVKPLPPERLAAAEQELETKEKAAKVLLAAAEGFAAYAIDVDTYRQKGEDAAYGVAMTEHLAKKYQKIAEAFESFRKRAQQDREAYFRKIGWDANKPVTLEFLVELRYLTKADLIDAWGNPLELKGNWCNSCKTYHGFQLLTYGVDGIKGTQDDVWIPEQRMRFAGQRRRGELVQEAFGDFNGAMPPLAGPGLARGGAAGVELDEVMLRNAPMEKAEFNKSDSGRPSGEAEPPRVRKFFPETLYFNPLLITDANGQASTEIKLADSITTWRLTSMASSKDGQLGSKTFPMRVFQDFFVDIDFPISLIQNDQVSVPVAVYNYLPTEQKIRLKAEEADWFTLLDEPEKEVVLRPDEVRAVYFTLRVNKIGNFAFTVYGYGEKKSDAISRSIDVEPDGKETLFNATGRLEKEVVASVVIPAEAIDEASKIFVKVYPGVFSQVVEGMDKILQMPFGCFEQTSSATYPNILVLDYMKSTGKVTPEIQMKAEGFVNAGYQRLLSYEVQGGGFEWFGKAPAHNVLTTYGLMEFYDMSKVHDVDPNVIARTQNWLVQQQQPDGSWKPTEGGIAEGAIDKFQSDVLRMTTYAMWGLVATEHKGPAIGKAVEYIEKNMDKALDNYTLALLANAFVLHDKNGATAAALIRQLLQEMKEEEGLAYWPMKGETPTYGRGESGVIETTALACQALLAYGKHPAIVSKVNDYIIKKKDPNGTWFSTQATIQALKALVMSIKEATQEVEGTILVSINGKDAATLKIDKTNSDVLQLVDLKSMTIEGENTVKLNIEGEGSMFYQVVGRYYLPYRELHPEKEPMSIEVKYEKTELAVSDLVQCNVTVTNNRPAAAKMVILDLGLPPGFTVLTEDLNDLVEKGIMEKYSLTGRQIIVYLREVPANQPIALKYRLMARFPIKAKAAKSIAYEYYDPGVRDEAPPQEILVKAE